MSSTPKSPNTTCAWCKSSFWRKPSSPPSKSGLYFCSREHKDLAFGSEEFPDLRSGPPKTRPERRSRQCVVCGKFSRKRLCGDSCSAAYEIRGLKECSECHKEHPLTEFGLANGTFDGRANRCKCCVAEYWQAWYAEDTEAKRALNGKRNRDRHAVRVEGSLISVAVAKRYGLLPEEVVALNSACGGICPICKELPATHIDHDHTTGEVRGLLCNNCNSGLGMFRDSCESMERAVDYLKSRISSP